MPDIEQLRSMYLLGELRVAQGFPDYLTTFLRLLLVFETESPIAQADPKHGI